MSNQRLPQTTPWAAPVNFAEFRQQYETNANDLFDHITILFRQLRATRTEALSQLNLARTERDDARAQLSTTHETIDNLEEQATQLNLDLNIARAGHTSTASTTVTTNPAVMPNFRSEKFPDPEKFNGSRAKLPGFLTQLRMKLEVNDDRFRNESAKIIYSISRLEGRALDQVVPLVNSKPSAPFSSVNAFIA
ncbi:hypothetical protein K3495_g16955, partial [Podosphaera aphanis]